MSSDKAPEVKIILERLKKAYNFKKTKQLADRLGVSTHVISMWKARNRADLNLILTSCYEVSPSWLLRGIGEPFVSKPNPLAVFHTSIEELPRIQIDNVTEADAAHLLQLKALRFDTEDLLGMLVEIASMADTHRQKQIELGKVPSEEELYTYFLRMLSVFVTEQLARAGSKASQ